MNNYIRHVFPGANTSMGFYSYFRYILPQEEARRIVCLKGGPGTGKSSIMKKLSGYFYDKSYNIEHHHCSSDSESLDAVVIKELKIAVLDGTSPHIVDPITPGAVDEILNLGDCWNEEGINANKYEIMVITKTLSENYRRIYRYLRAAKEIHEDWGSFNAKAMDKNKLLLFKEDLKNKVLKGQDISTLGKDRHLFATGITPQGIVTYIESLINGYDNVYVINGGPGMGKTETLKYILEESLKRGLYVEVFHDPFTLERIEHLFIPELSTCIVTSNEINGKQISGSEIYMEELCNKNYLNSSSNEMEYNKTLFYSMIDKALSLLKINKAIHDDLEKFYIENMNFDKLNSLRDELLDKFSKYEK